MRIHRPRSAPASLAALSVVVFATIWTLFAPMQLGGQAAYVVVSGNSMEPLYHAGDLVILRREAQAHVGEIFAYAYPDVGTVIHRIVAEDGGAYTFKGDHNTWLDGYRPRFADLLGRAWIHVPRLGRWMMLLRQPPLLATLAAAIGGLLMFGFIFETTEGPDGARKRRLKRPRLPDGWKFKLPELPPAPAEARETLSFVLAFVLFLSAALGIFAFTAPATLSVDDSLDYAHTVAFRYGVQASTRIYDQGRIQSGDPVFPRLNCNLDLTLDYALVSGAAIESRGTYRIYAVVSEANGWKRTLELRPKTDFAGTSLHDSVTLPICAVRKLIDDMVGLTGLTRASYQVAVVLDADLRGTIGGRPFKEHILPRLQFALDAVELYVVQEDPAAGDPLDWKRAGSLPGTRSEANTLSILGLRLPVTSARSLSIVALVLSAAGLALFGLASYRSAKADAFSALRLKLGPMLVRVGDRFSESAIAGTQGVIDVAAVEDLVRLAQNAGTVILEQDLAGAHRFYVRQESLTYRFVMPIADRDRAGDAADERRD